MPSPSSPNDPTAFTDGESGDPKAHAEALRVALWEQCFALDFPEVQRLVREGARSNRAFMCPFDEFCDPFRDQALQGLQARGWGGTRIEDAVFELHEALLLAGHPYPDATRRRSVVRAIGECSPSYWPRAQALFQTIPDAFFDWRSSAWVMKEAKESTLTREPFELWVNMAGEATKAGHVELFEAVLDRLPEGQLFEQGFWKQGGGTSVLMKATMAGNTTAMARLLDLGDEAFWRGTSVSNREGDLFHYAAGNGQQSSCAFLLERGYDTAAPGRGDSLATALMYGHAHLIEWLLDQGIDPGNVTSNHPTALHMVILRKEIHLIQPLLRAGNSLEACDKGQMTPLITAGMAGEAEAVRQLLDAGANIEAKDHKGNTALSWAASNNRVETFHVLREAGACLDAVNDEKTSVRLGLSPFRFLLRSIPRKRG